MNKPRSGPQPLEFSTSQLCRAINSDLKEESKSVLNWGVRGHLCPVFLVQSRGAEVAALDQGSERAASGLGKGELGWGRESCAGRRADRALEPQPTCGKLTSFIH